MLTSPRALIWTMAYLVVVVVSALPVLSNAGKFAGVYLMVTTLPWSLVSVASLAVLDGWLDLKLFDTRTTGIVIHSLCALTNAVLIYKFVDRAHRAQPNAEHDA
jgi:hypothetical protein